MAFPNLVHGDQLSAYNDLLSKATSAGYTAIDTDLGERGLLASVLANLMNDQMALTSLTVGSGSTALTGLRKVSVSLTPTPITAAAACLQEQLFTAGGISNITTADVIFVNRPSATGTLFGLGPCRVAGNGTIGISYSCGILTQTPAGEVYTIFALRT